MDNDNQIPPVQPMQPIDGGMPPNQPMGGAVPQNEVSRILMSQGSMPGNMGPGMNQGAMPQADGNMPQNPGMAPNGAPNPGMTPQGMMPQVMGPNGRPMVQQPAPPPPKKKDTVGLVKTIVIIAVSLLAVTFIGLFVWMRNEYTEKSHDVDGQIRDAVAAAIDEAITKEQAKFLEDEKYPYKTFAGPIDYGELTFEYPKTWSVYIAAAADDGGDFNAYFNPIQVEAVGKDTINALRVTIRNKSFEDVTAEYQKAMERKDANLSVESIVVFQASANRYTGTIPGTDLEGIIVVFKIRDKTVIMQTDSMLFQAEFDKLLETVKFNA